MSKKADINRVRMKKIDWYVYIVRCQDFSLYTGISTNVENRIKVHNNKRGSKAVIAHGLPVKLIYKEKTSNYSEALKREIQIKKLSKKQKEDLINGSTTSHISDGSFNEKRERFL